MSGEEVKLVQDAFASNWIAPLGPHVDGFEREIAACLSAPILVTANGALHCTALSSGTAALHLALRWLNLQPGDEVLCSTLTFSASVNPVLYERATPVFVDSDRRSWNMDPALLAEAVEDGIKRGKKPKAVILVHLYGQSADLDPIVATCARYEIPLIEDAAEALGAIYYSQEETERTERSDSSGLGSSPVKTKQAVGTGGIPSSDRGQRTEVSRPSSDIRRRAIAPGSVGLCGVLSFNGNKIITTSGGGALVSPNQALIEKARFWATQSRDPAPHYQHSEVGFNYRMSNVLAAIGRGQLRVLEDRVNARRANCAFYQKAFADLPGVEFMPEADFGRCNRWLTCVTIDPAPFGADREAVREALAAENIEARPVWKPMHRQPIFAGTRCYGGAVAEDLFERGLCLPSGSNLSESDLQRVAEVVRKCARG
jgi:dTDP-4-amino-4,6-dideoxygalactose transaminase